MDKQKVLDNIELRLKNMNTKDFNKFTTSQKEYLIEIENEISKRLNMQKNNYQQIKNNKISVSSIAKSVNISRKTIYNNQILKNYINYAEDIYNNNYAENKISQLEDKLTEQRIIIEKMVERDITIENLNIKVDQMKNEIKTYKKENEILQSEKNGLIAKINNLKKRKKRKNSLNIIK
jgi:hypothetical protein